MLLKRFISLVSAITLSVSTLSVSTCFLPVFTSTVQAATTDFVSVQNGKFMLNGQTFYHSGTNNYYLIYKDNKMVDDVLEDAASMNLKVVRTWGFLDGDSHDGYVMQPKLGVYADDHPDLYPKSGFERLDYAIKKAQSLGIKFVIPMVNYWGDFGGMPQYATWTGAGSTTAFYTNAACKTAYKNYVAHFLNHTNQYTGVKYKDDPTIMSIQLANEPRSSSDTTGVTLTNWTDEMSTYIRSIDANHLICLGDEGFYNRPGDYVDGQHNGQEGVDWDKLIKLPNISYGTVHDYGSTSWGHDVAWSVQWIKEHIKDGHVAGKPVIIEEFGSKQADRDTSFVKYTDAVKDAGGDAAYSWMLVGMDLAGGNYNDHWDDGFQFVTPSTTATILSNHATYMNNLNTSAIPGTFTQLLPLNSATAVSALPVFSWAASSGASSYSLAVSTNSDYSSPILSIDNITTNSYATTTPLTYSSKYYWKVTASNIKGSVIASNNGISFTTQSAPPKPGAFNETLPVSEDTSVSITPTFSWGSSSNADRYSLMVATDSTFLTPVINVDNIIGTSYKALTALNYGTKYYWKVTATNLSGSITATNTGIAFKTQLPSAVIDGFETYNGLDSTLQSNYIKNQNGNLLTVSMDTLTKATGTYSMKYSYTLGTPSYTGITKTLNGANWAGYDGIQLWVKPDGSNRSITIQFKEASGKYWESSIDLLGTVGAIYKIPFANFKQPSWSSAGTGIVNLASISEFSIYLGLGSGLAGSGILNIDDINLYLPESFLTKWDFNADNVLDSKDLAILKTNLLLGSLGSKDTKYDVNGDTKINILDYVILRKMIK